MPEFYIRRAGVDDAAASLACLRAAFDPVRAAYTDGAWLDTVLTPDTIRQRLQAMQVFVAVSPHEGVVGTIACAMSDERVGHLRGMAVLPAWQGKGVAEALLREAEAELMQQGCSRITLDTTEPLQRAMRFYEKHGYRRSGRVQDFFGMRLHEYSKEISGEE